MSERSRRNGRGGHHLHAHRQTDTHPSTHPQRRATLAVLCDVLPGTGEPHEGRLFPLAAIVVVVVVVVFVVVKVARILNITNEAQMERRSDKLDMDTTSVFTRS